MEEKIMSADHIFSSNSIRLIASVSVIILFYVIRTIINKVINSKVEKIKRRYLFRQLNNYFFLIITLVTTVFIWLQFFQSIITVLSIAVAALLIVSKEFLLNIIANGIIIARELFEAGDRIQIGDHAGDVIETGPVFFSIAEIGKRVHGDEPTGRVVKIPNSLVLTQPLVNYSKGKSLIWSEINFFLTVDSNWKSAKDIAHNIIKDFSYVLTKEDHRSLKLNSEEIMFVKTDPSVIITYQEGKINLTTRIICKYHQKNNLDQSITEKILYAFDSEQDIVLMGSEKGKNNDSKQ
jgi:small-conductance mechanosensitive channel